MLKIQKFTNYIHSTLSLIGQRLLKSNELWCNEWQFFGQIMMTDVKQKRSIMAYDPQEGLNINIIPRLEMLYLIKVNSCHFK